ncbi:ATP-dependent DNA helicase, partial [[Clostridium] symbiosum]|nr:ATP-dependent DNA helicase [[Clostridium] symbiosum]
LDSVSHIYLKLMNLMAELERYLEECTEEEKRKKVLDLYFDVRMFLGIYDRLDENYLIYSELEDSGRFKVRLFC